MSRFLLLLFLLCCVFISHLSGQEKDQKSLSGQFEQFSVEHGLSQNSVYCLYQDSLGFLWVGTGDGLNRFDGYQFKVFRHSDQSENSISGNRIHAIAGGKNGSVWVASDYGIDEYAPSEGKFFHHEFCNSFRNSQNPEYIAALLPDFEHYFVFSDASKLYCFDRSSERLQSVRIENIFALTKLGTGKFLAATYSALYECSVDSAGIHCKSLSISLHEGTTFKTILNDLAGHIWIGTMQDGLFCYSLISKTIKSIPLYEGKARISNISALNKTGNGVLWIGTSGNGLIRYDMHSGSYICYTAKHPGEINSNYIYTLFYDNSATLWIGTDGGGLNKLCEGKNIFHSYPLNSKGEYSMKGKFIRSLTIDKNGTLYISALENGLYMINETRKISKHFNADHPLFGAAKEIFNAYVDRQGELWVSTSDKLLVFSESMVRKASYNIYHANAFLDYGDRLLIGTNAGLYCYSYFNGKLQQALFYDANRRASGRWVRALHQLPDGTIAVGTIGGGIALFDPASNEMRKFPLEGKPNFSLSNQNVLSFADDPVEPYRYLWAGTRAGLNKIDLKSGKVKIYTTASGLVNDYVYGLLPDKNGYLWISSNNGLSRLNVRKGCFKNYDRDDGLSFLEFNSGAEVVFQDGTMLFGGTSGISAFHPDSVEGNRHVPTIVLTEFRVFDKPYPVSCDYSQLREINLDWDQNIFSFRFSALDLADPVNNQYAYIMEGFEKEWSYCGELHDIRYTGLKPGTYRFRVIGSNNHDVWNETGMTIVIHIRPPFWQTWWFRIMGTLLLIGLLSLEIWHIQSKKYKKQVQRLERQNEIEKERARIARDMHDEIGAILTRISILTDIEQNRPPESPSVVSQIGAAAREAVDNIGEIIWAMNPKNDSLADVLFYLRRYAAEYFQDSSTEMKIHMPTNIPAMKLHSQFRRNLFLFLKEVLQNVMKHACAKAVELSISLNEGKLELLISDDGIGFDRKVISGVGNGLCNLKRRADELRATFELKSTPGSGTTSLLSVPLGETDSNER